MKEQAAVAQTWQVVDVVDNAVWSESKQITNKLTAKSNCREVRSEWLQGHKNKRVHTVIKSVSYGTVDSSVLLMRSLLELRDTASRTTGPLKIIVCLTLETDSSAAAQKRKRRKQINKDLSEWQLTLSTAHWTANSGQIITERERMYSSVERCSTVQLCLETVQVCLVLQT